MLMVYDWRAAGTLGSSLGRASRPPGEDLLNVTFHWSASMERRRI